MRSSGNDHSVSWNAAYAVIKRQGGQLFKTSPEHASVMITEAVVQDPGNFPDCGRFLGDLFGGSPTKHPSHPLEQAAPAQQTLSPTGSTTSATATKPTRVAALVLSSLLIGLAGCQTQKAPLKIKGLFPLRRAA
jgi:hypothetical protein